MLARAYLAEFDDPGDRPAADVAGHRRLAAVPEPQSPERDPRPKSVLVVEDDPAIRLLCQVNLESDGFRVIMAGTGEEGLALAAAERPDLVLLDVMLPDGEGFDVAAKLDVPVVFLSARTSQDDLERGRRAGALDYVTKPFDPIGLPTRLREDLEELGRSGSAEGVWRMRFGPGSRAG